MGDLLRHNPNDNQCIISVLQNRAREVVHERVLQLVLGGSSYDHLLEKVGNYDEDVQ